MSSSKKISILGAGQAAAYAASEIRKHDKASRITIFSEENYLPYERPPLSKDSLTGKKNYEELSFFSNDFYNTNNIQIENETVEKVDFENKILITNDSKSQTYDSLLIATGSKNKKLNFGENNNDINNSILYLRNIDDSKKIKKAIQTHNRFAIVGGGFIGLEIASSIAQLGKIAHVIEMGNQLMGRVIPQKIASLVLDYHKKNGNSIFLNSNILSIKKINNGYQIDLNNNNQIDVDFIIAGIGSIANVELFENTSLKLDDGIVIDEFCRTSVEDVFAAGDVANFFHPFYGTQMRLESYQHAQNHGIAAAKNILGLNSPYIQIPWIWSDQFDLNLQLVGICNDFDQEIQRGDILEEGIIYFFLKNKKIIGACGIGIAGKVGRDIRLAGKISESNIEIKIEELKNTEVKLNKLLKK
jgi:3-phenylpropionate/trans-cinnamate dioxygenase ferredoxin reductase subunit